MTRINFDTKAFWYSVKLVTLAALAFGTAQWFGAEAGFFIAEEETRARSYEAGAAIMQTATQPGVVPRTQQ